MPAVWETTPSTLMHRSDGAAWTQDGAIAHQSDTLCNGQARHQALSEKKKSHRLHGETLPKDRDVGVVFGFCVVWV